MLIELSMRILHLTFICANILKLSLQNLRVFQLISHWIYWSTSVPYTLRMLLLQLLLVVSIKDNQRPITWCKSQESFSTHYLTAVSSSQPGMMESVFKENWELQCKAISWQMTIWTTGYNGAAHAHTFSSMTTGWLLSLWNISKFWNVLLHLSVYLLSHKQLPDRT